jgi:acetylornithine deacetylase/succinyl-diaminopimelate desuccinylase-like protein
MKNKAISLLQDLIRTDTSNPPGDEWPAVELLAARAGELGFTSRTFRTATNRGNIAISYNGSFHHPLILLSHLDVVPAHPEQWSHHPFSGELADGAIWGRGTIDTKQLTVMHLMAMAMARDSGFTTERDIVLIATSDEETGSDFGLKAMLGTPEAAWFDGAEILTEGGGFPLLMAGTPVYLIQTGQKGLARLRFTIGKTPGSNPFLPNLDDALRAAAAVKMLDAFAASFDEEVPRTTGELIDEIALLYGITVDPATTAGERYANLRSHLTPAAESFIGSMMRSTIVPTILKGGSRHPVKDGVYEIVADARLLPSTDRDALEGLLHDIEKHSGARGEILSYERGFESPRDPRLFGAIRDALTGALAETGYGKTPRVVPFLSSGGSDARHLTGRSAVMYGYSPVLPDLPFDKAVTMVHGVDEHISIESLLFGCRVMRDTLLGYSSLKPRELREEKLL